MDKGRLAAVRDDDAPVRTEGKCAVVVLQIQPYVPNALDVFAKLHALVHPKVELDADAQNPGRKRAGRWRWPVLVDTGGGGRAV